MYAKESEMTPKYKSSLFRNIAGWFKRHGMVLMAVLAIMSSVGVATFETNMIYAKDSEGGTDYGDKNQTSSPSYKKSKGNNPTTHDPGVIGVSVVTYNLNKVGEREGKILDYGAGEEKNAAKVARSTKSGDIDIAFKAFRESNKFANSNRHLPNQKGATKTGSAPLDSLETATDDIEFYPYMTSTGHTNKGKATYAYSNNLQHSITRNLIAMQTARGFDDSTLVIVPRKVASDSNKKWNMSLGQHVYKGGKTLSGKKLPIFYNLTPWYKETDAGSAKKVSEEVIKGINGKGKGSGIYYAKLKGYLKQKEKAKTKKQFITFNDGGKEYKVCNYARFAELNNKNGSLKALDQIIGYTGKGSSKFDKTGEKNLARAKKLYASMAYASEISKNTYSSAPESAIYFMRYTTAAALNNETFGTAMFSDYGKKEGLYGKDGKNQKMVAELVIRNLFNTDKKFKKTLASNATATMTDFKKAVLNNEYNTHYLDMLFCGYALARSSGDSSAVSAWAKAIQTFVANAEDGVENNKNVVIRLDMGIAYSTTTDITYVSTGDVLDKFYGFSKATAFTSSKSENAKSLRKGFIGFASSDDGTGKGYQAVNEEISNSKGVVTKKSYNGLYGTYYDRLSNTIQNLKTATGSGQSWYTDSIVMQTTKEYYFKSSKSSKVDHKLKNKMATVELLKMKASEMGNNPAKGSAKKYAWNYGSYGIDGYTWKTVEPNPDSAKFKLTIYSTKAKNGAPNADGSNIKDIFQSYSEKPSAKKTSTTITDDLYVKLTPDLKDKNTEKLFNQILKSEKYYVKVVFENVDGKILDGESKTKVKDPTDKDTKKKVAAKQQNSYYKSLNKYDDINKSSEKGDQQNYNDVASAKQIGGKDLQDNKSLIWRISNSDIRKTGFDFKGTGSSYVNWRAKVYIFKKSGSGKNTTWTNVLDNKAITKTKLTASDVKSTKGVETNNVIAQYSFVNGIDPDEEEDLNLSGTYESTPEAYAELKEGSVYNETFEAMAGTPSTRSLYFATGGSEFIVNMQAVYDDYNLEEVGGNKNSYRSTRTYKSIFKKVDCEYKKGDKLKNLAAGGRRKKKKKKERAVSSPFDETARGDRL